MISDVCDKYQVHLADVIAGKVRSPEVSKALSDIAEKVMKNNGPVQALEVMLEDFAPVSNYFTYFGLKVCLPFHCVVGVGLTTDHSWL